MAQSDVELVREGFDRLAAEGYEAMFPFVHEDFEMETPAGLAAEPQRYEGIEGLRRWWTTFLEVMDSVTLEARDFREVGPDRIVVQAVIRAVGGASGIETSQEVYFVVTVRDSKMARLDFAASLDDAVAGKTL